MRNVLLLNASYQPLRVISFKRAVMLLIQEKAEPVEGEVQVARSSDVEVEVPSVIKLRYMVQVPFNARVPLNRRAVMARDGGVCQYGCGRKGTTIDHVIPRSKGGKHSWDNVVACCSKCNAKKADKLLEELDGWKLMSEPKRPDGKVWLVIGLVERDEWSHYLSYI